MNIDSIAITLSKGVIDDCGGRKALFSEWKKTTAVNPKYFWTYLPKNLPKKKVKWVFFVIGGKIRYRGNIVMLLNKEEVIASDFADQWHGRSAIVMRNIEHIPSQMQKKMKGFQGFRYIHSSSVFDNIEEDNIIKT